MHSVPNKPGYLTVPRSGLGPGILVLHAWWGLNETIRNVCDRLAREGFVAFAPDLFNGRTAQNIARAERLSGEADSQSEANFAKIASAVDYLLERAQPRDCGLGVVGFSFGAYYALQLSGRDPERVGVVTLFYGCGDGDFDQAQASYLGSNSRSLLVRT